MSPATRCELKRLALTLAPAGLLVALGALASAQPWGLGLLVGGALAGVLVLAGGLMLAATHASPLHVAAFAALASFIVRIGGAGAALLVLDGQPWATGAILGLAGGLLAALGLDLWTWYRVAVRPDPLMTRAKESARA